MTLDQLATYICGKVNQNEAEDVAACKTFLQRRHEMLWQESLWKDALVEYRATLDPDTADYVPTSNYLPAKGVLLLPPTIERVLAARTAGGALRVQRPEFYYTRDFDSFARTGTACEFILLPPCVWELDGRRPWYGVRAGSSDAAAVLSLDFLDTDSVGVTRSSVTLDEASKSLGTSERLDALTKAATQGAVTVQVGAAITITNGMPYTLTVTTSAGHSTTVSSGGTGSVVSSPAVTSITGVLGNPGGTTSTVSVTSGQFGTAAWTLEAGFAYSTTPGSLSLSTALTLTAASLGADKRQRLRLIEIPTEETVIRVLGKRTPPTFSADNDVPGITGVDNTLIGFALADMLERERQYGKAQAKFEEAGLLLDQLKRQETVQQAHNSRIIPEAGYETDYFAESGKGWMYR